MASLPVNFALGLLFGVGLIVSGMSDPAKVLAFLDPLGAWDPSLAFVMAGGVAVAFVGYRLALRRGRPLLAVSFQLPELSGMDGRLVTGAALFGIGWGLGGLCPGPAILSVGLGNIGTLVFLPAMLAGMWIARKLGVRGRVRRPPIV